MAAAVILLSTALSVWLYLRSFCDGVILAKGGNSGNVAYDFFIGRELNPRSLNGTFDWKEFCELRPGLILWFLFDISMAIKQYQNLGYITGSMVLINIFQVRGHKVGETIHSICPFLNYITFLVLSYPIGRASMYGTQFLMRKQF